MPGIEKALGLGKEQSDEFLRFTAQTGMRSTELAQQNVSAAERQAALIAFSETTAREADARFGAGTMAKWRAYSQRRPAENFAQNIAPEFTRAGVPLAEAQQDQLATAYLELTRTSTVTPTGAALVKQVGKALTVRQKKVLRTVIDQRLKAVPQRAAMAGLAFPYGTSTVMTSPVMVTSSGSPVTAGVGGFVMSGPGAATPAGPPPAGAQRQRLIDSYKALLGDAASFMRLNAAQTGRFYEALADGGQPGYQSATMSASMPPQMIAMVGNRYPDVVRVLVVKEFGEGAAARWDEYRPLRGGLTYVDSSLLKHFYDADVPLTREQRLKLAAAWLNAQMNAQLDAANAAVSNDVGTLTAITSIERSLAMAENRNAVIVREARAWLDKAQVDVLFAQLDGGLESQRIQLRQQRAWAVQSPDTPTPAAALPPPTVGVSTQPVATPSTPPLPQQASDSMRRSYAAQVESSLRGAAPLLKLDAVQMQRLVALLADRLIADMQAGVRRQFPGEILAPGAYSESVANEFGAGVAERWTSYGNLRSGLPFVDQQLKFYYNAGEPLNQKQRLRLATDYQQITLAAVRGGVITAAGGPAGSGTPIAAGTPASGIAGAVQRMETELASAEATKSAELNAARAYLSKTQLDVLSAQLETNVATRRQTLQMMRETTGAAPPGALSGR
jgi:hypothetical protein